MFEILEHLQLLMKIVLNALAFREGSGEPAHSRSTTRAFIFQRFKVWNYKIKVIFYVFLSSADLYKINSFRNTKSLDTDQDQCSVNPDLSSKIE